MKIYKINFKHDKTGQRTVYVAMESLDLLFYFVKKLRMDGEQFVDLCATGRILLDPSMKVNDGAQYRLVDLFVYDKLKLDDSEKRVFRGYIENKYMALTHSADTLLNDIENLQMCMEGVVEKAILTNDILYTFSNIENSPISKQV